MNTVSLQVNTPRLFNSLRDAFSNKHVVIRELIQNARRAGATRVDIQFDTPIIVDRWGNLQIDEPGSALTLRDDGCGIDNLQSLFTLAQSDWEQSVSASENAFGMGFFAVLFAAPRIQVSSGLNSLTADTQRLLDGENAEVVYLDCQWPIKGTEVVLIDTPLATQSTLAFLIQLAKYSSIEIAVNGHLLKRTLALPVLMETPQYTCVSCEYGEVFIAEHALLVSDPATTYVLQDIEVARRQYFGGTSRTGVIVHLRPDIPARMPDRDKLIDEAPVFKAIDVALDEALETRVRAAFAAARTAGGEEYDRFICGHYQAIVRYSDLALQLDRLPASHFQRLLEAVNERSADWRQHDYEFAFPTHQLTVGRDDLVGASGIIHQSDLVDPDYDCDDDQLDFSLAAWVRASKALTYDAPVALPQEHWLRELVSEPEPPTLEMLNPQTLEATYQGEYIWSTPVVLADKVELIFNGVRTEITDGYFDGERAIVPAADQYPGQVVEQISPFWLDEYTFDEAGCDREAENFVEWIRFHRASSPADQLLLALMTLPEQTRDALKGGQFTVCFKNGLTVQLL